MTQVFALSVPTDIPWRRVCASGDMHDADPCDLIVPPRWRSSIALFRYASDKIDRTLDPEGPPWRPAKRRSILGFFFDVVREAISNMAVGCGCLLGILAAALALWGLVSLARRMWEQPLF